MENRKRCLNWTAKSMLNTCKDKRKVRVVTKRSRNKKEESYRRKHRKEQRGNWQSRTRTRGTNSKEVRRVARKEARKEAKNAVPTVKDLKAFKNTKEYS
jgi:hypothetical protein